MYFAYIMRGVPGSGKTVTARMIAGEIGKVHSTNDYFTQSGEYKFDSKKLKEYSEQNFSAFCESLKEGVPIVICDNSNIHPMQYEHYREAALEFGYVVAIVSMADPDPIIAAKRNIHNHTAEEISEMIRDLHYYAAN